MQQSTSPSGSDFRGDVPMYRAPDREEWEAKHGVKPFTPLSGEPAPPPDGYEYEGHPKGTIIGTAAQLLNLAGRAKTHCLIENSTLDREEAIKAHVDLDHICDQVKYLLDRPETDEVFYDPQDNRFWIYPDRQSGSDT